MLPCFFKTLIMNEKSRDDSDTHSLEELWRGCDVTVNHFDCCIGRFFNNQGELVTEALENKKFEDYQELIQQTVDCGKAFSDLKEQFESANLDCSKINGYLYLINKLKISLAIRKLDCCIGRFFDDEGNITDAILDRKEVKNLLSLLQMAVDCEQTLLSLMTIGDTNDLTTINHYLKKIAVFRANISVFNTMGTYS